MGFIFSIVGEVILSFLRWLIQIPLIWIGEIMLFLVTFGRHKPRWDSYAAEGGGHFVFLSEMSFWIGIITVCGTGAAIKEVFFSSAL